MSKISRVPLGMQITLCFAFSAISIKSDKGKRNGIRSKKTMKIIKKIIAALATFIPTLNFSTRQSFHSLDSTVGETRLSRRLFMFFDVVVLVLQAFSIFRTCKQRQLFHDATCSSLTSCIQPFMKINFDIFEKNQSK